MNGQLNTQTGYREGNKNGLECPSCRDQLTSVGTYKQMERDRVKWGMMDREDRDSHLLDLGDLGFCENCGGFVRHIDFTGTDQEDLADKVFHQRISRSISQSKSNNLRKHLKDQKNDDWRFNSRSGSSWRSLRDGTREPKMSDPAWPEFFRQYKIEQLDRAKVKQWISTITENE